MGENLNAKISFSFLSIYEKNVTCKRDPEARDRDETETSAHFTETETRPRRRENPSRDRLETEMSRPRLHPCYDVSDYCRATCSTTVSGRRSTSGMSMRQRCWGGIALRHSVPDCPLSVTPLIDALAALQHGR